MRTTEEKPARFLPLAGLPAMGEPLRGCEKLIRCPKMPVPGEPHVGW